MKTSHLPRSKNIPSVVLIKQHFSVPKEADVREATVRELKKLFPDTTAIKGKIVGLTCPSRGICDIAQVLITAASFLKPHCKEVRILTAMGTHGGGTSEGERAMASDRGVTEETVRSLGFLSEVHARGLHLDPTSWIGLVFSMPSVDNGTRYRASIHDWHIVRSYTLRLGHIEKLATAIAEWDKIVRFCRV